MRAEQKGHFLDCTFGGGGHTQALLEAHPETSVVACDRDPQAIARGRTLEQHYAGRLTLSNLRFSELQAELEGQQFDAILADLGMSTDHLRSGRGFSFADEMLDMRMDTSTDLTAAEIVNSYSSSALRSVLRRGGVGKEAGAIASVIVKNRPITSAKMLADLVDAATPFYARKNTHPATVVFQALRIEVNQEFAEIEALLDSCFTLSKPWSRFVFISFHSLEDKLVTRTLRKFGQRNSQPALLAQEHSTTQADGKLITSHAI